MTPKHPQPWRYAMLLLVALGCGAAQAQSVPAVAAASDLRFAMEEVAAQFQRDTRQAVKISYGSSGMYFRQIQQGAPFELFMSADESFVLRLHEANRLEDRGVLYAVGRIVLFAARGRSWRADAQMQGLRDALAAREVRRFAIANSEHAPYGRAAEQALRSLGLWNAMQPHLVMGENVSQAAQFAAGGSSDGGIFAYSIALAPAIAKQGTYVLLPEHLHEPLRMRERRAHAGCSIKCTWAALSNDCRTSCPGGQQQRVAVARARARAQRPAPRRAVFRSRPRDARAPVHRACGNAQGAGNARRARDA